MNFVPKLIYNQKVCPALSRSPKEPVTPRESEGPTEVQSLRVLGLHRQSPTKVSGALFASVESKAIGRATSLGVVVTARTATESDFPERVDISTAVQ